jgi:hypothetical protein
MSRLTPEERRRVFLAQQRAQQAMFTRAAAVMPAEAAEPGRALRRVLKTVGIVALIGSAVAAAQMIEFHPPASLVEVLLPRL